VRAENGGNVSAFSQPDQGVRAAASAGAIPFPPLEPPPAPSGNPITAAKTFLGKALFWDEQLSSTRTVSCGTCHIPGSGGSDPRSNLEAARATNPGFDAIFGTADDVLGSPGVVQINADGTFAPSGAFGFKEQVTGRKANSFINAGFSSEIFWDGRAGEVLRDPISGQVVLDGGAALETQALGPPVSAVEMAHVGRDWGNAAARITVSTPLALAPTIPTGLRNWIDNRNYPQLFAEAFGTPDVTPVRIALAIATYERTLFSDQTPLDRAALQIEPLQPLEEQGRQLFTDLQCNVCHEGSTLSDNNFHNIGVRPLRDDAGRFAVTGGFDALAAFRTPGLRNAELRSPLMHNGRFNTLEEVVEFYNRGGDFPGPNVSQSLIRPLNLTEQQKASLAAFMRRPLTDPRVAAELPPFDRPALYLSSNRVPTVSGTGRAGAAGRTPQVTAISPPLLGNPNFTVGVSQGAANANAVLVIDDNDPGVGAVIPPAGSLARVVVTLNGDGFGSVNLALPADAAQVGRTYQGRWYVPDAAALNGFAVSPLLRFTIFAPSIVPAVTPTPAPAITPTPDVSAPKLQFAQAGFVVNEDYAALTLSVTRTGNAAQAATVDYESADGGAAMGCAAANNQALQSCDYSLASGTLNFAPGETSRSFTLIVNEDSYVEGPETFTVRLLNAAGATLGTGDTANIAISDDDAEPNTNPIDGAENFVQQQYHDFLARRPDAGGLAFWTGQVTNCAPLPQCLEGQRIGVSAAFFISQEFQETGFFVYRLYRAAFATMPGDPLRANVSFPDFMQDRNRVVGAPDLEQQRAAFANAFVQRPRFLAEYPATMTNAQFVNRLFDNAGLTPFAAERQAEIDAMNNQGRTRAQVLRNVIEIPAFSQREYNPAFVLAQYFDYLRRDPDTAGYGFWLGVLNQFPQRFPGMVCAFITSAEYQLRFGPQVTRTNALCENY
jgi:cytochrome c peroxidase